jgi:hypothetical protein
LAGKFDVLVFPDQSESSIATGHRKGSLPDEFTGGLNTNGAAALKAFANDGGVLIFLNESTRYAAKHLGLGVRVEQTLISLFYAYKLGGLSQAACREARFSGLVAWY